MTKKQSTKRVRLVVLLTVIILTVVFLVSRPTPVAKEEQLLIDESAANDKIDANSEFLEWRKKFGKGKDGKDTDSKKLSKGLSKDSKSKTPSKDSKGSKDSVKEESNAKDKDSKDPKASDKSSKGTSKDDSKAGAKAGAKANPKTGAKADPKANNKVPTKEDKEKGGPNMEHDEDEDLGPKPPSKPRPQKLDFKQDTSVDQQAENNKAPTRPDRSAQPPKFRPNGVEPPVTVEESPDPNNPNEFLGGIEEISPDELLINGNIFQEEGDEEELAKFEGNKIGDIEHEDSFGMNPKNKQGFGRLGVPRPDKFGKALPKTVTIDAKEFPKINDNFYKLKIKPLNFRIYSHNVKNGGHDVLVPGEEVWNDRYRKITNSIKSSARYNTIVTLQEVYKFQMLDIMNELNKFSSNEEPEWSYYARGRIDGEDIGEFVPIVWKNSEWECVYEDTLWLNDKNERMSLEGWDAKYLRILSYVTLKHKETGNYVNVFNTHLDHIGELSRIGSAELIVNKMKEINNWPSFLCGDLNNEPKGEVYQILTDNLVDTAEHVTPFNKYGHYKSTVTGFEGEVLMGGGQNIDYIFSPIYTKKVTNKINCDDVDYYSQDPADKLLLRLEGFGLLHSKFNGVYMSDHRPLVADFYLAGKC